MNNSEFKLLYYKLKLKGLSIPKLYTTDMIRHHNRGIAGETRKHFMCKCICSYMLYNARHAHFVEYEFPNKTVTDVFDSTDGVAIEFETTTSVKKEGLKLLRFRELISKKIIRDVIIIDISKFPEDWIEIESILRKKLGL